MILADAHVHIYDCFDIADFLDAGLENFELCLGHLAPDSSAQLVLLLTETSRDNYFSKLRQIAQEGGQLGERWTLQLTQEEGSLYAKKSDSQGIFLIAGSQIVTSENLEVLALMTANRFQDGASLERTAHNVVEHGGLPVIPWGFGKWLGRRGQIVSQFLNQKTCPHIFLGDNSGRPVFWRHSPIFECAKQVGIAVLPGTDPLPFPREVKRPGKFGFRLNNHLNSERPAETLKDILLNLDTQPSAYGVLENPLRFVQNQVAMQVTKRRK